MVAQIDKEYIRHRPTRLWPRLISYALFEGRPLTTRGRWINPLIFSHFALARHVPQLKTPHAPVFIIGTGRSGTTILGLLLSMHRDVGFLNEPKAMWHAALQGGEDLIGSYERVPARYRLAADDLKPGAARHLFRIHGSYLRLTGARRVVDKYPELIFRVPLVKAIFPDARFLFIARNGWDTCASIMGWSNRHGLDTGSETHDWWGVNGRKWSLLVDQIVPEHPDLAPFAEDMNVWTDHRQRAIVEWIVTMREGLQLAQSNPRDVLHVPFERMCASPRAWMERISEFTGLPRDPRFLSYAEHKLSPAPKHPSYSLEPCLEAPFADTMRQLGYAAN